jgi:hypothetical protein
LAPLFLLTLTLALLNPHQRKVLYLFAPSVRKTSHPLIECFIKYPHKKAAWDEKKRAARKRRNENGDGKGELKKPKANTTPPAEPGETATAIVMILGKLMCIAIDN